MSRDFQVFHFLVQFCKLICLKLILNYAYKTETIYACIVTLVMVWADK